MTTTQGGAASFAERLITKYFLQFLTKNLLRIILVDPPKFAFALFLLKTLVDSITFERWPFTFSFHLWPTFDNFTIAFFYSLLLSANLLGETLYEFKWEPSVGRMSSIWVSPLLAGRYLRAGNVASVVVNVGLKIPLALLLQSLVPSTTDLTLL